MFFSMGNLHNEMKRMELNHQWQQKKKDQGQATQTVQSLMEESQKRASILEELMPKKEEQSLGIIRGKLDLGKRLSSSEMAFLRENHPELYAKAYRIEVERRIYEQQLRQCRTKEQVRALRMGKTAMLAGEVKAAYNRGDGEACAEIGQRGMAATEEHTRFLQTRDYSKLPDTNYDLAKKKKRKVVIREPGRTFQHMENLLYDANAQKRSGGKPSGKAAPAAVREMGAAERREKTSRYGARGEKAANPEERKRKKSVQVRA